MADYLVVKAKVKDVISDHNIAADLADGLNSLAKAAVSQAAIRADGNNRKTIQPKDVYMGAAQSEPMLLVKSKVKDAVTDHNVSSDFADALNALLVWHVKQAAARADANGRRTVMAKDL